MLRSMRLLALILLVLFAPHAQSNGLPSSLSCTPQKGSNENVCCRKAKWEDVLLFFLSNYVAHAASTRTQPGQSNFSSLLTVIMALLFPMSGALRGAQAIATRAALADTDLQTAARAGALCAIVHVSNAKQRQPGKPQLLALPRSY